MKKNNIVFCLFLRNYGYCITEDKPNFEHFYYKKEDAQKECDNRNNEIEKIPIKYYPGRELSNSHILDKRVWFGEWIVKEIEIK